MPVDFFGFPRPGGREARLFFPVPAPAGEEAFFSFSRPAGAGKPMEWARAARAPLPPALPPGDHLRRDLPHQGGQLRAPNE